jgi:Protein of unknown function (DUF1559)
MSTRQRNRPISWTKVFIMAVGTVCMGIMLLLVLSSPQQIRNGNRSRDQNNLKQIALAIINYSATNRGMPPPAIYSDDGKPLLSWRVLILPYLEEGDLFEQFRLNEAWDSPHKSEAHGQNASLLCSGFACRGSASPHILPRIRWERRGL